MNINVDTWFAIIMTVPVTLAIITTVLVKIKGVDWNASMLGGVLSAFAAQAGIAVGMAII